MLTGFDSAFLYAETPRAHMAGGLVSIYDPSTAPGGKVTFKGILAQLESRLHEARVFRQRLVRVPFDFDHPYWIEDPDFDLEFHVRQIALPKPGDWRQLCIQVARWSCSTLTERRTNCPVPSSRSAVVAVRPTSCSATAPRRRSSLRPSPGCPPARRGRRRSHGA